MAWQVVLTEMDTAVERRRKQLHHHIETLQNELRCELIAFERGFGRVKSTTEVEVVRENGDVDTYSTDHIIIATGSRPRYLSDIPIDEKVILTSDGISALKDYPKSMVIVGAGVIGCEFATIFAGFGRTKVYLIDKSDRILPFEDEDLSNVIERNLEARGVTIHRESRLVRMDQVDGEVEYELEYRDGRKEIHRVEKALISVGRVPNTENMGLAENGVKLGPRNHIEEIDGQSSVKNIYAVGDISWDLALVNVGELEGRYMVERIFDKPQQELCYDNISTIMFLCPETAGVGMNEQQARDKGIEYKVASIEYSCIPRAIAMRENNGFFKLLVTNDDEMRILGMRAVGEHASSAIQAVALLISMGKGISELSELIHPHPSIIEGVQECVRMLLGKSILKPSVFGEQMICRKFEGGEYCALPC